MRACRLLGHRFRFSSEGPVMRWTCGRCGAAGEKRYGSAELAALYARAFDRTDAGELGRRAPWFGLFPLRLWHTVRARRRGREAAGERSRS